MSSTTDLDSVEAATSKLIVWLEAQRFCGWDPHDALNSPLVKSLTFGSRLLGIAWLQAVKRSPLNLRPLLGVPKGWNPKGVGLFLAAYARRYMITGEPEDLQLARYFAEWLAEHISPGYSGACWGYNFDWPNRGFYAAAGTPTVVNTSFIALAFLDAHRLAGWNAVPDRGVSSPSGEQSFGTRSPLVVARSACDFVLDNLNRLERAPDELCFSYTPTDSRYVHNANLLGAQLLAEVSKFTGEPHLAERALAAARYSARRQRDDGSWPYGDGASDTWVDNFHTGFVLVSLKRIGNCLETGEFDEVVARGYRFWKCRLFLGDGRPKYYPNSVYPSDIHSVATAILTFLEFADFDVESTAWAMRVALWGIEHMQDSRGCFHYQINRHYRIRIPYLRWSQAWMLRALTELAWFQTVHAGRRLALAGRVVGEG